MSGCPSFGVAVDEGDEASDGNVIHATLEKPLILVLAVDDADGAILLDEGDGEELALGLGDEAIEFGLHGLVFCFGFGYGPRMAQFFEKVKVLFDFASVLNDTRREGDHGDDDDGGEDGNDWIVHGSLV